MIAKNHPLLSRYSPLVLVLLAFSFAIGWVVVLSPFGMVLPLVLPAFLLVTLFILKHPPVGLYLIILAIPFDSHFINFGPVNISASNALIVITLLAWSLAFLFSKVRMVKDVNYLFIAWIMSAALMSIFGAVDPTAHVRQILTLMGCVLTYFLTVNLIKDTKTLNRALIFLGLAIFMSAAVAIIQSIGFRLWGLNLGVGNLWEFVGPGIPLTLPRVTSTWLDPNAYAFFLLTGLPALLYFALRSKSHKLKYIVFSAFVLFGLVLSYSRGAWVGLAASLVTVFFLWLRQQRNKKIWPVVFAGFTSMILLVGTIFFDVLRKPFDFIVALNPDAAEHRIELWGLAINTFLANPILGVGLGGFLAQHGWVIHNSMLEALVGLGLLGALPFFIMIVRTLRAGLSDPSGNIGLALAISFIGVIVASFFISALLLKNLWLSMGLIAVAAKIKRKERLFEI